MKPYATSKSASARVCSVFGGKMPSQMKQCNKINVSTFADLIEDKKLLAEDQVIHICVRKRVHGQEAAY